jgi:hypothetical protein
VVHGQKTDRQSGHGLAAQHQKDSGPWPSISQHPFREPTSIIILSLNLSGPARFQLDSSQANGDDPEADFGQARAESTLRGLLHRQLCLPLRGSTGSS